MRTTYEIARTHYDASARGDFPGMFADIADDCAWTEMDGFPCAGTYIGPDAIRTGVFEYLGGQFENYAFTLERLLDAGAEAVGIGTYSGTHRATGKSFTARVVHVWKAENDKIRRFEQFTDTLRVGEAMRG